MYEQNTETATSNSNLKIVSNEQTLLSSMEQSFNNKPFLRFQCQGFEIYLLQNLYIAQEDQLLKILNVVPI